MYSLARKLSIASYLTLLGLICTWVALVGPVIIAAKLVLALLLCSGLLLVAFILYKGTQRAYIWLCFILLFYFLVVVQALFIPTELTLLFYVRWFTLAAIVFCFCASILASRYYPRD